MIKAILLSLFTVFAISGLCEFLYTVRMFFFMPKKRVSNYLLVMLESENAVKQLNFLWQKIIWHGDVYAKGIIALCDNIDADEQKHCQNFAENKNIFLCCKNSTFENINSRGEII